MIGYAEIMLKYKRRKQEVIKIDDSMSAEKFLRRIFPDIEVREYLYVLMLNNAHEIIGYSQVGAGSICSATLDLRLMFATVLKTPATCIILAHNHPSGSLQPSLNDDKLTRKVRDGGILLDIKLLDHIILTANDIYSYDDEGKLINL